jgi:hypothetical protein
MPDDTQLKQIINRAIARAYETHGQHLAEGMHAMPSPSVAKVIANAVFDALKRANAFRED